MNSVIWPTQLCNPLRAWCRTSKHIPGSVGWSHARDVPKGGCMHKRLFRKIVGTLRTFSSHFSSPKKKKKFQKRLETCLVIKNHFDDFCFCSKTLLKIDNLDFTSSYTQTRQNTETDSFTHQIQFFGNYNKCSHQILVRRVWYLRSACPEVRHYFEKF